MSEFVLKVAELERSQEAGGERGRPEIPRACEDRSVDLQNQRKPVLDRRKFSLHLIVGSA